VIENPSNVGDGIVFEGLPEDVIAQSVNIDQQHVGHGLPPRRVSWDYPIICQEGKSLGCARLFPW
jgi:hypothetical protein